MGPKTGGWVMNTSRRGQGITRRRLLKAGAAIAAVGPFVRPKGLYALDAVRMAVWSPRLAEETNIRLEQEGEQLKVFLDNTDVTRAIRSQAVTKAVSAVSMVRRVREVMVREQRRMGELGGVVLEGRDIGTVVFPGADLKIFLVANVTTRAKRRLLELQREGVEMPLDEAVRDLRLRDRTDSRRAISPLRKAADALVIDTTDMTIGEQVNAIVDKAKEIIASR